MWVMNLSTYQKKKIEKRRAKARRMYRQGLTTREIGKIMKKSHTWVWKAVAELSTG